MKLASLLTESSICFGKTYRSMEEAVRELLGALKKTHRLKPPLEEVVAAVMQREALGGTAFPTGIAVPHARLENFPDLLIGVCIPQTPILSQNQPVKMVVLMLTSKTETTLYLNALSSFLKLSQDAVLFEKLIESGSPEAFIRILQDASVEVKKDITVQAIMSASFPYLVKTDTVKHAADLFYKHSTSYLPILSAEGDFIGELTVLDLFRIGLPDYVFKLGNLKFLKTLEPFEELLRKEEILTVAEVMKKPSLYLDEDSSIIEAVYKFVSSNRRHLPVMRDRKIVGILSYMHILHKVLRA